MKRYLILEDGSSLAGEGLGSSIISTGELAIETSNFGYQEALTDPTNAGKILVFTTPMIGGNGINAIDYESINPTVKGIIANDVALNISDNENFQDLDSFLKEKNIPAIYNIDTRALVHRLTKAKTIKASIMDTNDEHAFDQIKALVLPKNRSASVSTKNAYAVPNVGKSVAIIDLGLKHSMLRELSLRKINATVLPYNTAVPDIKNLRPEGIIISGGPGKVKEVQGELKPILDNFYGEYPIWGIGLGFLVLSDYLNFQLVELPKAYNGTNYPIINDLTKQIWQVALNIDCLVLPNSVQLELDQKYYDLHSQLLAGFSTKNKAIATAFNAEGAPGSLDALQIFDNFVKMMG
ncbi:carbamoyl phosphate synthase small subunit [Lactobacillus sp. ESL0236]|uniref:carbamoyl phosphate synthase small subunit n=1 Tax=unclassified Lactobacillus TaxID=2620435 RepID=UPI000EFC1069|nr:MULTISPECIES: carbamoyl phosphate synthase small subunit [unclassified Lactobacillus]RMC39949.1 carbamoyl phosphate synthase small subunit [Lactobacillus sp. ESL0237]RMC44108.1 carbamoyl phosphate synthase small subunit [Lactobacillus sp. ESL0234]RMC45437.1 carbamoyl phosphate synthase small subunit [Lactobacillus sp. ESL0236]